MTQVSFGLFDWIDRGQAPLHQLYAERLQLLEAADAVGFFCYHYGTPARVREQMARLLERSGCNYVICAFAWGTLPHAQAQRSLRLFAEEVMPAFAGSAALVA